MQNDWILDVLADLKSFAQANGLGALCEQLDDTTLIAAAEISSQEQEARKRINVGTREPGQYPGGFGRSRSA
jgi:hypothetical protein